ncbi:MAG: adenylyltransferase/cytidyltransferase family protein [Limisphaerales bacterium]
MSANSRPKQVVVMGAFDDLRSRQIRFLEEAARFGEVTALLWTDDMVRQLEGRGPRFPESERAYVLRAVRFVRQAVLVGESKVQSLKSKVDVGMLLAAAGKAGVKPDVLVVNEDQDSVASRDGYEARGIGYRVLRQEDLRGFPVHAPDPTAATPGRKRVVVTGSYDWVHSGHVRFFEEVSAYGDLYVIVGHDANIRLLKGAGHPLFPQEERRYLAGSIRYVTQALITSGQGWLDADPEIRRLKPDIYAVNEDGDKGGKREYCASLGIQYLVLKRAPAPGLPRRTSTDLRGF